MFLGDKQLVNLSCRFISLALVPAARWQRAAYTLGLTSRALARFMRRISYYYYTTSTPVFQGFLSNFRIFFNFFYRPKRQIWQIESNFRPKMGVLRAKPAKKRGICHIKEGSLFASTIVSFSPSGFIKAHLR
jgi:hypothetical protein